MTYIPTKEELEELGLKTSGYTDFFEDKIDKLYYVLKIRYGLSLFYSSGRFHLSGHEIHLQSLEDLKTLIRLLTPQ